MMIEIDENKKKDAEYKSTQKNLVDGTQVIDENDDTIAM